MFEISKKFAVEKSSALTLGRNFAKSINDFDSALKK